MIQRSTCISIIHNVLQSDNNHSADKALKYNNKPNHTGFEMTDDSYRQFSPNWLSAV